MMEETQEFKIISALAEPELPSSHAPLAVQQLLAVTSMAHQSNGLGGHLNNTWVSLMEIVSRTPPERQSALVKFTRVLQQRKVTNPANGMLVGFEEDYNKLVWTEVPNMGICIADEWNFDASNPKPDEKEATIYLNKTAFLAQLTASPANSSGFNPELGGPFDFSLYALWAFREAFEFARPATPVQVTASCYWFLYAADKLWDNVRAMKDCRHHSSGSNPAVEGDGMGKRDWVGFGNERWGVWVKGLRGAAKNIEAEGLGALVERALREIKRVENQ